MISGKTRLALGEDVVVDDLGELPVKGKERPVQAFVLRALTADRDQRDQGLEDEHAERDR